MLRLLPLFAALALTSACAQESTTVHTLFDGRLEVAIPGDYRLYDRSNPNRHSSSADEATNPEFVLFGGNAALSRKFPNNPYNPTFLDHFAGKDVQAKIQIMLVNLIPNGEPDEWEWRDRDLIVPRDATARAIHERFCEGFTSRWGTYGFAYFDPETAIGRCVNFAGAFVAVFTRRVGDCLVLIGAMDFVEVLLVEKKGPGVAILDMTPAEKWRVFRAAANADVAEQVLLSAKVP